MGRRTRGLFSFRTPRGVQDCPDGTSNTAAVSELCTFQGLDVPDGRANLKGGYVHRAGSGDPLWQTPITCLATRGPNNTLIEAGGYQYPDSHEIRGDRWGCGHTMSQGFTTVIAPNGPSCAVDKGEWNWGVFPPQSFHPGGVNLSLADGSVRFISETINTGDLSRPDPKRAGVKTSPYGVWGALGSRNGGEALGNF